MTERKQLRSFVKYVCCLEQPKYMANPSIFVENIRLAVLCKSKPALFRLTPEHRKRFDLAHSVIWTDSVSLNDLERLANKTLL